VVTHLVSTPGQSEFMAEWLDAVGDSLKASTRPNYLEYIRAYVEPLIGDRRLQDITVPVLKLLYLRLLTEGRVKVGRNAAMYAYWSQHRSPIRPSTRVCPVTSGAPPATDRSRGPWTS
jgi:hypothetical protein